MSRFYFDHLVELCRRTHEQTQRSTVRAMDRYLAARNWFFGWDIVEFEHGMTSRGEIYGKKLIARLSGKLQTTGLRGCSPTNLRKFREFYLAYPEIQQTLSAESFLTGQGTSPIHPSEIGKRFAVGWSHYVTLLTIDNADERRFYEIEAQRLMQQFAGWRGKLEERYAQSLPELRQKVEVFSEKIQKHLNKMGVVFE